MRIYLLLLLCVGLMLPACDGSKKEIAALQKQTEDIHDEAMKDLAEMNRVARSLKELQMVATMTPEQSEVFEKTLKGMNKAEEDMMAWMAGYKAPEGKPAAEALAYLEDQKSKITQNKVDILAAIAAGKKLLPSQ